MDAGTSKALVRGNEGGLLPSAQEWTTMASVADVLIKSGLLPAHVKTPQAALAIMLKGRELGVPVMQALSSIIVVQGKPTCNAELMLALIYRDQGDEAIQIEHTDEQRCLVAYKRRSWGERRTYAFTMEDARRAGLASGQTWQKYPAAMLRARAISAVARMAFPDSIAGMYVYDEMGLSVTVEGGEQVVVPQGESAPSGADAEPEPETNGRALPHQASGERRAATRLVPHQASAHPLPPDTDWTGTVAQLRARIERESGLELRTGQDWAHLARLYEQPEPLCAADMTQEWLLALHQEMTARSYSGKIAVASSEDEVITLVREALGDREKRHISMAHYLDLSAQGEARKAELSAPLLAGAPQAVAS